MKNFKSFMVAIAMVMVSGAANAQSVTHVDDYFRYNDNECFDNDMDLQQDRIAGTYSLEMCGLDTDPEMPEIMHVYADGTYLLEGVKKNHYVCERGFWQANGDTYLFHGKKYNFQMNATPNGLYNTKVLQIWARRR